MITTTDLYPASWAAQIPSKRVPKELAARFSLNGPKASVLAVPVHIKFERRSGRPVLTLLAAS